MIEAIIYYDYFDGWKYQSGLQEEFHGTKEELDFRLMFMTCYDECIIKEVKIIETAYTSVD